jgi:hypothetical protein
MRRSRNAASSFNERLCDLFPGSRARANPWVGPGLGVAVSHQLNEFLRGRFVAAAAIAALLRHRAANLFRFRRTCSPNFGRHIGCNRTFDDRLAGFAGRAFASNIDVALAHDCYPLLGSDHNAELLRKVATAFP